MSSRSAPSLVRNQSLQRAASLLWALAERPAGVSTAELARATGLPSPTAARLLATLTDLGLADRLPGELHYVLGRQLVRLARAADPYRAFVAHAQPALAQLATASGESATISAASLPDRVEVIAQTDAETMLGAKDWVGKGFQLFASAAGKAALAHVYDDAALGELLDRQPLERLTPSTIVVPDAYRVELERGRRRGYSEGIDELEDGMTGISVVVVAEGMDVLVLSISGPSSRLGARRRRELAPLLQDCAERLAYHFDKGGRAGGP